MNSSNNLKRGGNLDDGEERRCQQHVSIAATAASTALPPANKMSRPASAAAACGVATAAVGRWRGIVNPDERFQVHLCRSD
jgi:hypothetical protein